MRVWSKQSIIWLIGWALVVFVGVLVVVRLDIAQRREIFQTNARIAHGMLSQRAAQHDAILATLMLLSPERRPEQRLPAVYPQVLAVLRRNNGGVWPDVALQSAEDSSRVERRATIGPIDAAAGQYTLVLAGEPSNFALRIDVKHLVTSGDWPIALNGPIRATLELDDKIILLQPGGFGEVQPVGLTEGFVFEKQLAVASQPFKLRLTLATGPAEWPWKWFLAWAAFAAFAMVTFASWLKVRRERHRAMELLRVGQVARLNALGELAGGMAHELNQPLAAVLASTQAAQRLLSDNPPELATVRHAMALVAGQAQRAADVVARLRRLVEMPDASQPRQPVRLETALRNVLDLLEPVTQRRRIEVEMQGHAPAALADPVALEQIMHNLLGNAMQALEDVPAGERRLILHIQAEGEKIVLTVRDNGPGIAPEALPHVFEPFYTTRRGGLGLGLSLCETLAHSMDGTLTVRNAVPGGTEFLLTLPEAKALT